MQQTDLKIDQGVPFGSRRQTGFAAYLKTQFPRLRAGDSFDVMQLEKQATNGARGIQTPRRLASRIAWQFTRWATDTDSKLCAAVRADGESYRIFIRFRKGDVNV